MPQIWAAFARSCVNLVTLARHFTKINRAAGWAEESVAIALFKRRFVQLEPVVRRTFDIATMARLSVGLSWATLSESQRQQVIDGFGRYISAIYADRFDSYAGQKLLVTEEQPSTAGVIVHSQIVKANGEPVKVDYLMRRNGDAWLISDVYLDGAISEVATHRSEFAAILRNEGVDGLIAALNRKADALTSTSARAF
jgi:phospholipid transport system substrate-binding protein